MEQCAAAAEAFRGAGRRFEVYGECNGAVVMDDYAHHPTELRATLNTAKSWAKAPDRSPSAVYIQPDQAAVQRLCGRFADPGRHRANPHPGQPGAQRPSITSKMLADKIPGSVLVDSLADAADWVRQNAREGDLVITLGCGDVYKASKMMVE